MKPYLKIFLVVISSFTLMISCNEEETPINEDNGENTPTASSLLFPNNNTECNEGEIISDTETAILFQWEEANHTVSYVLTITDLNTGTAREISTSSNEFFIHILRGTPYSWSVKSKGTNKQIATSETWRFYNAGLPEESHPPFPAEAISPKTGSSIEAGTITLEWEATDIDADINLYTVYLDTANPPVTELGNSSMNSIDVTTSSGQMYYWKVHTTDAAGNTSYSQIFEFKVN